MRLQQVVLKALKFVVIAKRSLNSFCKCNGDMSRVMGHDPIIRLRQIEICQLDLRYGHTRIQSPEAVLRFANSLKQSGQIVPVLVVPGEHPRHILIDGYLRVAGLKHCGQDTVWAKIWHDKEQDALVHVLAKTQDRQWDVFEQAGLIKELNTQHQMSQGQIARLLGKDKSWVSRRLALLDVLSDDIIEYVRKGYIATWSAHRILTPLARANAQHAKTLAENLKKKKISTRNLVVLFDHYKKSNRKTRDNLVQHPHLFLKALFAGIEQNQVGQLQGGPETKWLKDIKMTAHILRRLIKQAPMVIYAGQSNLDKRCLLTAFEKTKDLFLSLDKNVRERVDDIRRKEANGTGTASGRMPDTTNQPTVEDITQRGSQNCEGTGKQRRYKSKSLPADHASCPATL